MTAAQVVQANHEKLVGIQWPPGADQVIPPAGVFVRISMPACYMVVAGKRMANHHRIGFIGIEFAVSLVNEVELRQHLAALEREWLAEVRYFRGNNAD